MREKSGFWNGQPEVPISIQLRTLWGLLASRVYANARHFATLEELKSSVCHEWSEITPTLLNTLAFSTQERCIEMVSR